VLTSKGFDLLHHLVIHPRQVFTRGQILESVWGSYDYIGPSTVVFLSSTLAFARP
jgi:DNA-binding response OmpR family regulator